MTGTKPIQCAIGAAAIAAVFAVGHFTGKKSATVTTKTPYPAPTLLAPIAPANPANPSTAPASIPPRFTTQVTQAESDRIPAPSEFNRQTAVVRQADRPIPSETQWLPAPNVDYGTASQAAQDLLYGTTTKAPRYNNVNPSAEELDERAQIVADQADWRTWLLNEQLQLTPEQQATVFPIYARAAQAYTPLLVDNGAAPTDYNENGLIQNLSPSGGSVQPIQSERGETETIYSLVPDYLENRADIEPIASDNEVLDEIFDVLDPDQQIALEEDYLDRDAWWSEIVAVYEQDYDAIIEQETRPSVIDDVSDEGSDLSGLLGITPQDTDADAK